MLSERKLPEGPYHVDALVVEHDTTVSGELVVRATLHYPERRKNGEIISPETVRQMGLIAVYSLELNHVTIHTGDVVEPDPSHPEGYRPIGYRGDISEYKKPTPPDSQGRSYSGSMRFKDILS